MDELYLDTVGVGLADFGKLEVLDLSPEDFEFDDFNTNAADEFGFDRQMNWNNSIGKGLKIRFCTFTSIFLCI